MNETGTGDRWVPFPLLWEQIRGILVRPIHQKNFRLALMAAGGIRKAPAGALTEASERIALELVRIDRDYTTITEIMARSGITRTRILHLLSEMGYTQERTWKGLAVKKEVADELFGAG